MWSCMYDTLKKKMMKLFDIVLILGYDTSVCLVVSASSSWPCRFDVCPFGRLND